MGRIRSRVKSGCSPPSPHGSRSRSARQDPRAEETEERRGLDGRRAGDRLQPVANRYTQRPDSCVNRDTQDRATAAVPGRVTPLRDQGMLEPQVSVTRAPARPSFSRVAQSMVTMRASIGVCRTRPANTWRSVCGTTSRTGVARVIGRTLSDGTPEGTFDGNMTFSVFRTAAGGECTAADHSSRATPR